MNYLNHIFGISNEKKRKLWNNYFFYMREMWKYNHKLLYAQITAPIPNVIYGYMAALIPAYLIQVIQNNSDFRKNIFNLCIYAVIYLLTSIFNNAISQYNYEQFEYLPLHYTKLYSNKVLKIKYDLLMVDDTKTEVNTAWSCAMLGRGISDAINQFSSFWINLFGIFIYGIIIARTNCFILIVSIVTIILSLMILSYARKQHNKNFKEIGNFAKECDYLTHISADSVIAKDLRIFNLSLFVEKKYELALNNIGTIYKKIHQWYTLRNYSDNILTFIRNCVVYLLLAKIYIGDDLSLSTFVFLLGIIASFNQNVETFCRTLMKFNSITNTIDHVQNFMELSEEDERKKGLSDKKFNEIRNGRISIRFDDVSFRYNNSSAYIYEHLNLTISAGEKIAIIGLNGVGKSTLAKLICGLYRPCSGHIFINEIDGERFTRLQRYQLVSALFQGSDFFPATLDENICCSTKQDIDYEKLVKVLKKAGMYDKYISLPEKGRTLVNAQVDEDGVEFSGGEKQKFLFARMLYKNTPIAILDEPTANLDPVSEYSFYVEFSEALVDKTVIFISHRLASTRFCDRIILIENGKIIEEGSHKALMKLQGRYFELFNIQANMYNKYNYLEK